jgi:hypothetical protein
MSARAPTPCATFDISTPQLSRANSVEICDCISSTALPVNVGRPSAKSVDAISESSIDIEIEPGANVSREQLQMSGVEAVGMASTALEIARTNPACSDFLAKHKKTALALSILGFLLTFITSGISIAIYKTT